jgi:uncharacterized membrane protein YgaE (UPF0421/DUF939 family)
MGKKHKKELSSERLKNFKKELAKLNSEESYLDKEKRKIISNKKKVKIKIRKEREVLRLENRIRFVKKLKR